MGEQTNIEWCDHSFNPWTGCAKVSPGCDHCYAEAWSKRAGTKVGKWGGTEPRVRTTPQNWSKPRAWNSQRYWQCACGWRGTEKGMRHLDDGFGAWAACPACGQGHFKTTRARVFCASLADVFDNQVPASWRADLFALIASTPNIDWLILTKRIGNARAMLAEAAATVEFHSSQVKPWTTDSPWPNVWIGATVVNQAEADRDIPKLLGVPARVRFLSIEPLLNRVILRPCWLHAGCGFGNDEDPASSNCFSRGTSGGPHCAWPSAQLNWIIAGGESGPGARPMHPDWATSLRDQCSAAGVPFLFKQWGAWKPISQMPEEEHSKLYTARRKAKGTEDQAEADEAFGRRCTCESKVLHEDGSIHEILAPMAFQAGCAPMTVFKVGTKSAGRLLDGVLHNNFPTS